MSNSNPGKVRLDSLGTAGIIVVLGVTLAVIAFAAVDALSTVVDYITATLKEPTR